MCASVLLSVSVSAMPAKFLFHREGVIHRKNFLPWPLMGNAVLPWFLKSRNLDGDSPET